MGALNLFNYAQEGDEAAYIHNDAYFTLVGLEEFADVSDAQNLSERKEGIRDFLALLAHTNLGNKVGVAEGRVRSRHPSYWLEYPLTTIQGIETGGDPIIRGKSLGISAYVVGDDLWNDARATVHFPTRKAYTTTRCGWAKRGPVDQCDSLEDMDYWVWECQDGPSYWMLRDRKGSGVQTPGNCPGCGRPVKEDDDGE